MSMHMGHAALRVTDLDAAAAHAQMVLGLREVRRSETQILLSSNEKHHELQLLLGDTAGFDHIGLEVESADELAGVVARAQDAGATILDEAPTEPGLGASVRFVGPAGVVYEVYDGMDRAPLTIGKHLDPGIRKFGHLTFYSTHAKELVTFWRDALGFRLSDYAEGLTWVRCDADHHGLAVAEIPEGGTLLHHHAWEVQDLSALARYCDDIAKKGLTLAWGPVRHGPGFNLATYLADAPGNMIEVYTDLLHISDDRAYEPIDWTDEPRALNLWGPPPGEEVLRAGTPVLAPTTSRPATR
jgi:catechol 2,3-dioxygenase